MKDQLDENLNGGLANIQQSSIGSRVQTFQVMHWKFQLSHTLPHFSEVVEARREDAITWIQTMRFWSKQEHQSGCGIEDYIEYSIGRSQCIFKILSTEALRQPRNARSKERT